MINFTDERGNTYNGLIKKALEIDGVIEKTKAKVSQGQGLTTGVASFEPIATSGDRVTRT
ncbi:hypothetical protein [Nonlabens xiamenensis]|uniref:hypothetical protein n=1 Tax=Nonlabens xiamenensis TaxID=2341043 RepID=UPI000F605A4A|nr:hypothetical protein [Nonlabens xiamenensis]